MKSIEDQIRNKCIHFNGIMNRCCKAGVDYDVFRGADKPFKFPCIKQGGECSLSLFRTEEEVKKEVAEIEDMGLKAMAITAAIKSQNKQDGRVSCTCGGEVAYTTAHNGHIWARCNKCGISFNE